MEDFFRPAEDTAGELGADRHYPRGRLFPFSFFSVHGRAAMERLEAEGATLAGPQYRGTDDRVLAEARQHGLKVIYTVMAAPSSEAVRSGELSDEEIARAVRERLAPVMDDDSIAWWYVRPEELRYWRPAEMRYLEVAARTIRQTDPKGRPVWMYDPNHRNERALRETARHLDIVGKGMYTNYAGMKNSRVWCRWSIEQQVRAIAAANPDAIPIAVPEMFQQPDAEDIVLIDSWVRHDVYAALVAGARGVVVFSAARRRNFTAHEAYMQAYLDVHRELCGEMNLGQVFLFGQRRGDLEVHVTDGPQSVKMVYPSGSVRESIEYPSVSFLNAAYGSERYVILVNSAEEPVEAMVVGLPYGRVMVADVLEGARPFVAPEGEFPVELAPLGVKVYRIYNGTGGS